MKRVWDVFVLTLAANFLALAGLTGWLYQTGRLNRERAVKIREVLFPPPVAAPPATQPSDASPTTQPTLRLEQMLASHANATAGQQVDFIRQTFDSQMAQLERRQQELQGLKVQIDLANQKLTADRAALDAERKQLSNDQQQARRLAADQGFQDSLNLYNSMPPRQVKAVFLTLSDDAVMQYLQSMQPRTAGKIIKEFKAPDEIDRIQHILERMRRGQPASQPTKE